MKKKWILGLVILLALAFASGCSPATTPEESVSQAPEPSQAVEPTQEEQAPVEPEPSESQQAEAMRFLFVSPFQGTGYWTLVAEGFKDACAEMGVEADVVGTPASDVNELYNLLETGINDQYNAIGTAGFGGDGLAPVVTSAIEKDIPVVFADCDSEATGRLAYVGTNNIEMGKVVGEQLVEATGGTAKIAFFKSIPELPHLQMRIEGIQQVIDANSGMEVVVEEDGRGDVATTISKTEAILEAYPDVTAFVIDEGLGIEAIGKVLKERDLVGKIALVGTDNEETALQYVADGTAYATVAQKPYFMGYYCAKELKSIKDGNAPQDKDTGVVVIKKDDAANYDPKKE